MARFTRPNRRVGIETARSAPRPSPAPVSPGQTAGWGLKREPTGISTGRGQGFTRPNRRVGIETSKNTATVLKPPSFTRPNRRVGIETAQEQRVDEQLPGFTRPNRRVGIETPTWPRSRPGCTGFTRPNRRVGIETPSCAPSEMWAVVSPGQTAGWGLKLSTPRQRPAKPPFHPAKPPGGD